MVFSISKLSIHCTYQKRFFLSYETRFLFEMAKILPSANGKKNLERSEKLGFFHIKSVPVLQFFSQRGTFEHFLNKSTLISDSL